MNKFLDAFAKAFNHYRIVRCCDGAGWHTRKSLVISENIPTLLVPPYSPALNLTEDILDYNREQKKFDNYTSETLAAMEDQLEKSLLELNDEKDIMKSMYYFEWLKGSSR